MKHLFLLLIMCLPMMLVAQKKVAVYVTSDSPNVGNAEKEIIGSELVNAILKTKQYKAVERTADFLQQISKEQGYQHSGNVDDDQISALGKQFGVDYVCVAYIISFRNTNYVHARLIDVETATVQAAVSEVSTLANVDELTTAASRVAQALIMPDGTYQAPVAENSSKFKYKSAKKATAQMADKPEGQIVRNSYNERLILGMKEYSYGSTQMDSKAFADFLWKNCPEAYIKYHNCNSMIITGWSLLCPGIALFIPGCIAWGVESGLVIGPTLTFIGLGLTVSGCVLLPIGYKNRIQAIDIYNGQCSYKRTAACTLNLQSSRDGIGIALTF